MGQWHISIEGTGVHHNTGHPEDANRMASRFVQALKSAGHEVTHATFTQSGLEDIEPAGYERTYAGPDENAAVERG